MNEMIRAVDQVGHRIPNKVHGRLLLVCGQKILDRDRRVEVDEAFARSSLSDHDESSGVGYMNLGE